MAWYSWLFELLSKIHLVDVHLHVDINNNIEKISFGKDYEYKVENGYIINSNSNEKIKLEKVQDNLRFILPDGTIINQIINNKEKNINSLDKEKKVFTRSDIGQYQIPYLSINQKNEMIVKILKPYLDNYRNNLDLGSLLIACTIIKFEDEFGDKELINRYYRELHGFGKIGHMIYNLFRSGILETEIIPYLKKIIKLYPNPEEIKRNFLIYWYNIIDVGYPTAYFAKEGEIQGDFYSEINWRFNRGERKITVYSRTSPRNFQVRRWLRRYTIRNNMRIKESKPYKIGYSKAVKFELSDR